jgi:hypothetical protein
MRYVKTTSVVRSLIEENNSDENLESNSKNKKLRSSQNVSELRDTMGPPMLIEEVQNF